MDSDMPCHAILPQFIVQVLNKDLKHSSEFQSAVKIEVWKAFMFALVECFRAEKGVCVAVLYICLFLQSGVFPHLCGNELNEYS